MKSYRATKKPVWILLRLVAGQITHLRFSASGGLEEFFQTARTRYSRIIVDTPPISADSDSLLILPLMDGVLYTIKFNAVKRKPIGMNMRRLMDSSVPVFSVVLNSLKLSVSGYYYSYQYHKYKDYHYRQTPQQESGVQKIS